jgi:hypothetical protein
MVQNIAPIFLAFNIKQELRQLSSAVAISLQLSRLWRDRRKHETGKIRKTNNWTQVLLAEHADT